MKRSTIRKASETRTNDRVFLPHSSWARSPSSVSTAKRLPPEEFWERLGL